MCNDATKAGKIIINESTFYLRTLKFKQNFEDKLVKTVEDVGGAIYPMLRTNVTSFSIPSGSKSFSYPVAKLGKQAIRVFLALINNDAFNGDLKLNPFNFAPNYLTNIVFSLNGKQLPSSPLSMNWDSATEGLYVRTFNELMRTTGVLNMNGGFGIDRSGYPQGFFIIGQKLIEAFTDVSFAPEQQGTLSINLTFKTAPPKPLTAILMMEYQNVLKIEPNGGVKLDYDV